jgi:hypothetical protein
MDTTIDLAADPYEFTLAPEHCALLIIDAQRDFLEPGGFGEMLGYDVSQLRRTIEPNRGVGFYLPEFHDMGLAGCKRQLAGEGSAANRRAAKDSFAFAIFGRCQHSNRNRPVAALGHSAWAS